MEHIAVALRLEGRRCVLVGQTSRLARVARSLENSGAVLVSADATRFDPSTVSHDTLIVIDTGDQGVDQAIARQAAALTPLVHLAGGNGEGVELLPHLGFDEPPSGATSGRGEAYLIGAGPGDPELLTLRGLRLLRQAEVVLYDRLVAPRIVEMVREDAELVYVGKRRNDHAVPQEDINSLLIAYARQGKRVARLKGGDPFIFGRGGEELERLMDAGIPFQVVPGITAASGCAAYAGIPLTHRDFAQAVTFVTGHRKNGEVDIDFASLVRPGHTVVFYMGLAGLADLCAGLIRHGMSADMPAALVQHGTTETQRVLVGTVGTLDDIAQREKPRAPTLVIVGEVVRLRRELAWFHEAGTGETPFWQD